MFQKISLLYFFLLSRFSKRLSQISKFMNPNLTDLIFLYFLLHLPRTFLNHDEIDTAASAVSVFREGGRSWRRGSSGGEYEQVRALVWRRRRDDEHFELLVWKRTTTSSCGVEVDNGELSLLCDWIYGALLKIWLWLKLYMWRRIYNSYWQLFVWFFFGFRSELEDQKIRCALPLGSLIEIRAWKMLISKGLKVGNLELENDSQIDIRYAGRTHGQNSRSSTSTSSLFLIVDNSDVHTSSVHTSSVHLV